MSRHTPNVMCLTNLVNICKGFAYFSLASLCTVSVRAYCEEILLERLRSIQKSQIFQQEENFWHYEGFTSYKTIIFSAIFRDLSWLLYWFKVGFSPEKMEVVFLSLQLCKASFNPSEMGSKYKKSQNPNKRGGGTVGLHLWSAIMLSVVLNLDHYQWSQIWVPWIYVKDRDRQQKPNTHNFVWVFNSNILQPWPEITKVVVMALLLKIKTYNEKQTVLNMGQSSTWTCC